jgi:hypothetical protein
VIAQERGLNDVLSPAALKPGAAAPKETKNAAKLCSRFYCAEDGRPSHLDWDVSAASGPRFEPAREGHTGRP